MYSAAFLGLCQAAQAYNGTGDFPGFAGYLVPLRIADQLRIVNGRDRKGDGQFTKQSVRAVLFTDAPPDDTANLGELATRDLPVGWELESEDAVESLLSLLPPNLSDRMRRLYLHARYDGIATNVAKHEGVSQAALSLTLKRTRTIIAKQVTA